MRRDITSDDLKRYSPLAAIVAVFLIVVVVLAFVVPVALLIMLAQLVIGSSTSKIDPAKKDEAIAQRLKSEAAKHGLKPPQLMMPLRMLVAGTTQTPSLDAVLALIPREAVRSRIAAGLQV